MFPIWNPRYKQPPHCRFRLGDTSGSRKHLATWNKRMNSNFHTFNSSYNLLEMFPIRNRQWKQLPHCRFGLGATPVTRKHHATWNKWMKIKIHPFNSVCSAPEMFPTWNPWWKQLSIAPSSWVTPLAPGNIMQLEKNGWKTKFTHLIQVTVHQRCSAPGIRSGNNSPIAASGWETSPAPGNIMQLEIKEWISIFTHLFQVTVHRRCSSSGIIV